MRVIAVLSQKTLRKSELFVQYKKLCPDQKIRNNHVKHRKPEALISNQARLGNAHLTSTLGIGTLKNYICRPYKKS